MTTGVISDEELLRQMDENWFHTIELKPNVFSPTRRLENTNSLALTRKLLAGCEVRDASCLDVGTMEGLVAVLLCRRPAAKVVATDRYDRDDLRRRIALVKKCLGVDFDYWPGLTLQALRKKAPTLIKEPFDLIVFSGVLYHMYDPLDGIALVRSMTRPGGIVIVEAAAVFSDKMSGYFNAAGYIIPDQHNYWNLSVTLLDYLLRYFRLKPIDCGYLDCGGNKTDDGSSPIRIGVTCRAMTRGIPDEGDKYMVVNDRDDDVNFPDWAPSGEREELGYSVSNPDLVKRPSGAVNLYETLVRTRPLSFDVDDVRLRLSATY